MKALLLSSIIALTSCAAYNPVVDPRAIEDSGKYKTDVAECRELAKINADQTNSVARSTVIGGAVGAGVGTLLGVITGDTVEGLAAGAVIGGTGGLLGGLGGASEEYAVIYRNCMTGRGYHVLN